MTPEDHIALLAVTADNLHEKVDAARRRGVYDVHAADAARLAESIEWALSKLRFLVAPIPEPLILKWPTREELNDNDD